jgi:integrase
MVMARAWNKLSANFVRSASKRGRHADGGNLHLQISKSGTKAWVFLYERNGAVRSMGLGSARIVSLSLARELAAGCREQLARSIDPIDARKAAMLEQRAARAKLTTFKQCAEEYHAANLTRWTNAKHRAEWISALRRFAFPIIGHLSVGVIDSSLVHKVLQPLVTEKAITASRLRGRIETVLDYAKAAGRRTGENPANKTVILHMLPMKSEKANVVHQPALPYAKVPDLMTALRATPGKAARLLELQVLTAMRSEAVRPAHVDEFDLDAGVWTIPASRMKALDRDHRIPLGSRAVEIVRELRDNNYGDLLFSCATGARPIGKNEVGKLLPRLLKAIGHDGHAVPHGFRSALKDWCHEECDHRAEVVEQALGHKIKNSVERAYRRGDLFKRRQILMLDWENYCSGVVSNKVVQLLRA